MQIIIFRHGHKSSDLSLPALSSISEFQLPNLQHPSLIDDPSLSPKGLAQAKNLVEHILKNNITPPTACWVSNKKRTLQTFNFLIDHFKINYEIKSDLNSQDIHENSDTFNDRIKKVIFELSLQAEKSQNEHTCLYLCSHYDWIEQALKFIPCQTDLKSYEFSSWAPGQYLHFKIQNKKNWLIIEKGVLV